MQLLSEYGCGLHIVRGALSFTLHPLKVSSVAHRQKLNSKVGQTIRWPGKLVVKILCLDIVAELKLSVPGVGIRRKVAGPKSDGLDGIFRGIRKTMLSQMDCGELRVGGRSFNVGGFELERLL